MALDGLNEPAARSRGGFNRLLDLVLAGATVDAPFDLLDLLLDVPDFLLNGLLDLLFDGLLDRFLEVSSTVSSTDWVIQWGP